MFIGQVLNLRFLANQGSMRLTYLILGKLSNVNTLLNKPFEC